MKKRTKTILAAVALIFALPLFASHANTPPYPNFGLPRTEEMMFLVLQIGVIIFAARLGGAIAAKLKMPSILGELAAGIVIGPWALGGVGFGGGLFSDGLFHGAALRRMAESGVSVDATTPALYGIATLASVILLFLSGLETNIRMFLKYSFVGTLVGVGGVIFSFFLGDWCAVTFLPRIFDGVGWIEALETMDMAQAMMQPGPLYMGIMSTATSVGITARILSERKKMDSEEGTTIMAGAVIDDVLGLIVLAVGNGIIVANSKAAAAGSAAAVDWGHIAAVASKAFGVWLGVTFVGLVMAPLLSIVLKKMFKSQVVLATMTFGLSLILAGFFESMGLAMIIGAYVMGLSLARTDLKHMIQDTLTPVYTFLVPVFFCVMGMMVDMSALCSRPVLVFGAIYTAAAVFAKVVGCMLPALCCGFNALGGLRIGAGMVPRGEVALIIAGLGLSAGYLSQEIFGIGIMMTLVTTVIAPPALVALFTPQKKGVRNPRNPVSASREVEFELAGEDVAELMMAKLLVEFRNEGFFVTCLSQADHIWEVAMNAIELSIRRIDNKIRFDCTPAEEAMVMTAWMEVSSQINDLARSIAKPTRREEVRKIIASTEAVSRGHESVGRYLQGFVMLPSFKAKNKVDAIKKMVEAIAEAAPRHVTDVAAATAAVLKREASMPTGLDHGIAVPHGRDASVNGLAGAVALIDPENGALPDYETIDRTPVKIIVLTLASDRQQAPYLQLMSFISRALRADYGAEHLMECKTPEEMRRFFRRKK